jgi:hypothetical protein
VRRKAAEDRTAGNLGKNTYTAGEIAGDVGENVAAEKTEKGN